MNFVLKFKMNAHILHLSVTLITYFAMANSTSGYLLELEQQAEVVYRSDDADLAVKVADTGSTE